MRKLLGVLSVLALFTLGCGGRSSSAKPDLIIDSITHSPTTPVTGDTVTFTVTVKNQGQGPAGAFNVGFWSNLATAPVITDTPEQNSDVTTLAAGATTTLDFTVTAPAEGTYTAWAFADRDAGASEVTEIDETNNAGPTGGSSWTVVQPDIIVQSVTSAPANPQPGNVVTFTVTVKNQGTGDAGAFNVGFWSNLAVAPVITDTPEQNSDVTTLAAGATATLDFTVTAPAEGTYTAWAFADRDAGASEVAETDETNNAGPVGGYSWTVVQPDLVVESITHSPASPQPGDDVTFTVTVKNQGTGDAGAFNVGFWSDLAVAPVITDTPELNLDVAGLAAGASTTLDFTVTAPAEAPYTAWAFADRDGGASEVAESDETNNAGPLGGHVWNVVQPDLVVQSITHNPASPTPGSTVTFTVTVANQGTGDAAAFNVGFWSNLAVAPVITDTPEQDDDVSSLAAGASTTLTFTMAAPAKADYLAWAYVDREGGASMVAESDESNNAGPAAGHSWTVVSAPDLIIESITSAPAVPTPGTPVIFTVTVKNQGDTAAGLFNVGFWSDKAVIPVISDAPEQNADISGLPGGATTTLTFTVTAPVESTYTAWAYADRRDGASEVDESDETNNAGPVNGYSWNVYQPDLIIESMSHSPIYPIEGATVTFTVTVKNQGTADAGAFNVGFWSASDEPSGTTLPEQETPVTGLAAGASTALTFNVTAPPDDKFTAWSYVDSTVNAVAESNEANNVSGADTWMVTRPDLIIESITHEPIIATPGSDVTFTVTIANIGLADAGLFGVAFWSDLSYQPTCFDTPDQLGGVTNLAGGASTTVTFVVTAPLDGLYTAWAYTDFVSGDDIGAVNELNDFDNTGSEEWMVERPDLVITSITHSPTYATTWDIVEFTVTVKNNGLTDAGSFMVGFWADYPFPPSQMDLPDDMLNVPGLASGESTVLTFWCPAFFESTFTAWGYADWDGGIGAIDEKDETNNITADSWTVSNPDLIIESITSDPEVPTPGSEVTFTVVVRNQGLSDAWPFPVGFWSDLPSEPGVFDIPEQELFVDGLPGGASQTLTFVTTAFDTEGDYTAWAFADSEGGWVEETDETNNAGSLTWTVAKPDLVIIDMWQDIWDPVPGTLVTVTATVYNQGMADAGPFDVGYWSNLGYEPGLVDVPEQLASVAGLASDESVDVTFQVVAPARGSYLTWAYVDTGPLGSQVDEEYEDNNVYGYWWTVYQPDLIVWSVDHSPTYPIPGQQVTFTVQVYNQGDYDAGPFTLGFWSNKAVAPVVSDTPEQTASVGGLGAWSLTTINFTVTAPAENTYTAYAFADCLDGTGEIAESDENNNAGGQSWTVSRPDLVIWNISQSPAYPTPGSNVSFTVTVYNQGLSDAGLFNVGFWSNKVTAPRVTDLPEQNGDVNGLVSGQTKTVTFTIVAPSIGSYTAWAYADRYNCTSEIIETDETNNAGSLSWSVALPDLVIQSVTSSPAMAAPGAPFNINVTVRNQGNAAAGLFNLGFFQNSALIPRISDTPTLSADVGGIGGGGTATVTFNPIVPASGTLKSWAYADRYNGTSEVTESNETNNAGPSGGYNWSVTNGTMWTWGRGFEGQLGDGTSNVRTSCVQVLNLSGMTAAAGGAYHTLGLRNNGTVWAWGMGGYGQLGYGGYSNYYAPVQTQNFGTATAVAAGEYHSVALRNDGVVFTWGYNSYYQLGWGSVGATYPFVNPMMGGVSAIGAGGSHTLAIQGGTVVNWGRNWEGEMGQGYTSNYIGPCGVGIGGPATAVAGGYYHSVALRSDGYVFCWGLGNYGQLGYGGNGLIPSPVQANINGVTKIAAGYYHTVAVRSDGTVWTWGYNSYGQLGDGTTNTRYLPVQVPGLTNVVAVAAGLYHTVALKSDGTIWAWGSNTYGQLGDGTYNQRLSPVQVPGLTKATAIAAGYMHSIEVNQ